MFLFGSTGRVMSVKTLSQRVTHYCVVEELGTVCSGKGSFIKITFFFGSNFEANLLCLHVTTSC